ncbi:hypothetical protein CXP39_01875 [Mesoplasma syrphidae]|uniref:J domain-containing protein n=1 Tax=Mesoplasma syrphidae TaxID=225999 RepID=A0A2K9C238_9MOLU|nr:DnaJ domain-containing protein [Mesoplasma syrphidae]AUF83539.1 hypothetical protein CXP39_01875 [Mesoplasma syrphidae]
MEKSLSNDLVTEIMIFNKPLYEKKWVEYQNKLRNDKVLQQIANNVVLDQPCIKIENYMYTEYLTTYTGSSFYNTLSYIKTICSIQVFDNAKIELVGINSRLQTIINNGFAILEDSKSNLEVDSSFEDFLNDIQVELYQEFLVSLKNQLGNKIIPSILKTYLNSFVLEDELILKKHQLVVEKAFKIISSKTEIKTQELLKRIYGKYSLKNYFNQETNFNKKKRFDDFLNDNVLFNFNFEDQEIALKTLGLSIHATKSDIKKAYRELAIKYHPDNNHSDQAEIEMKRINIAYNLLKQNINEK